MANAKKLLLVRHGESMHNISDVHAYGDTGADATLFDAPLSPLGEKQVTALAGNKQLSQAELVICSPLTRAVQTLLGAFPKENGPPPMPVEMWHVAAEHMTDSCDIGSGATELRSKFPMFDFSLLPEVWWYTDEETSRTDPGESRKKYRDSGFMEPEALVMARIDDFVAKIRQRKEHVIAVFGHSDYFNFLMEKYCGDGDKWLENAEVYPIEIPVDCHMRVTVKKSPGFYIRSAKRMLEGFEDKDGKKVEPVRELNISGLGNSINAAIAAASAVEAEGVGVIKKIETSYPEFGEAGNGRGCARISITVCHK